MFLICFNIIISLLIEKDITLDIIFTNYSKVNTCYKTFISHSKSIKSAPKRRQTLHTHISYILYLNPYKQNMGHTHIMTVLTEGLPVHTPSNSE